MNAEAREALAETADRLEAALLDHLAQRDKLLVFEEMKRVRDLLPDGQTPEPLRQLAGHAYQAGREHNVPLGRHFAAELVLQLRERLEEEW